MLSRSEQYTILVPSGEIIGSEPKTCSAVTEEPSGFINSISFFFALREAMVSISGASCLPVTPPAFESTSVMLRVATIPIEGSERTKTILSLSVLGKPAAVVALGTDAGELTACCPRTPGVRVLKIMTESRGEEAEPERDIEPAPPRRIVARLTGMGKGARRSKEGTQNKNGIASRSICPLD